MIARAAAIAALALAGCNSLLGVHDLEPPGGAAAGDVTGVWEVTHVVGFGPVFAPENLAAYELSAEVPDAAQPSGFRSIPATVTGPGTFAIAGVPDGPYALRIRPIAGDRPVLYYWTAARELDLGYKTVGRPAAASVAGAMPLALEVAGGLPEWSSDATGIYAPDAGSQLMLGPAGATPRLGIHATFDWSQALDFSTDLDPAPNFLDNDHVTIVHYRRDAAGGTPIIVETAQVFGATLSRQGTTTMTTVAMAAPPPTTVTTQGELSNFALHLDGDPFAYGDLEVMAYPDPSNGAALHDGSPLAGAFPVVDGPPLFDRRFPPTAQTLTAQIAYRNPFGTAATVVDRFVAVQRRLLLPHAGATIDVLVGKSDRRALTPALGLAPLVAPAGHVQLDGSDPVAGVRDAPHGPLQLRWDPVAAASFFDVAIERVSVAAGVPQIAATARIRTAEPAVAIPAELIAPGERYQIRITSVAGAAGYRDGALRRMALPSGSAEIVTDVMLFSATCGNGRVDPGEDCDTAGASATCDVDCTAPVCGDGLVNPLAGEVCDAAVGNCTPACTRARCGDGYVTAGIGEGCDDGNQIAGDGCAAFCQLEGGCGDGVVNPYEECDDGNGNNDDGCRIDCKLPACGDAIVDAALGEQCDDGNRISGDGCTATCQTEPPPT